jgi:hypothetical protein
LINTSEPRTDVPEANVRVRHSRFWEFQHDLGAWRRSSGGRG